MRKIVHGLVLHVTMHFLCVMRQFLYDVLCIHIHVTVHWLVRNTAVRPDAGKSDSRLLIPRWQCNISLQYETSYDTECE